MGKIFLLIVLSLVLVGGGQQYQQHLSENQNKENPRGLRHINYEKEGNIIQTESNTNSLIDTHIKSQLDSELVITYKNNSEYMLRCGLRYTLQKMVEDKWITIEAEKDMF